MEGLFVAHLLIAGSFWFYLALLALYVVCTLLTEFAEKRILPGLIIVAALVAVQCFTDANILLWAWRHPFYVVGGVVLYFLPCGTLWSAVKWYVWNKEFRYKRDELAAEFLKSKGLTGILIPDHLRAEWQTHIDRRKPYGLEAKYFIVKRPELHDHKARITSWIAYWPFSLTFTALNNPVRHVTRLIYHRMTAIYERISDSAWAGTENDFVAPPVRGDR